MNNISVNVRKWGDSIAIIIPKEAVKENKVEVGDKLNIIIQKGSCLKELFGVLKRERKI